MSFQSEYDALLFDLDGTLTEPSEGISKCILHALSCLGRQTPPPESLRWCIGPPLSETFARLLETTDETLIAQAIEHYRARFRTHGMFENAPFPDVTTVLTRLAKTHTLFVVTSKPWVFAEEILSHFGLEPYFWKVYGSELDGRRGNKGDLLKFMLEREGRDPSRLLMIGDREHDIKGAKVNGIRSAGVLWGFGSRDELAEAGADFIVSTPSEIEAIVHKGKGMIA